MTLSDPLCWSTGRSWIESIEDAIRWACTLEATAPKLGNVHPARSFPDLNLADFWHAGDALAEAVASESTVGGVVLAAVRNASQRTRSNANLGIALLVAPLAIAANQLTEPAAEDSFRPVSRSRHRGQLQQVLNSLNHHDAEQVYEAIQLAQPGGLDGSGEIAVPAALDARNQQPAAPIDLMTAMRTASAWDAVAAQYANGFAGIYDAMVPRLTEAGMRSGDMLAAIRQAHLTGLANSEDTLIARKGGRELARQSQQRAAAVLATPEGPRRHRAEMAYDAWLRGDGNRRNPGTTADLVAAGLFVLLVTTPDTERSPDELPDTGTPNAELFDRPAGQ